MSTDPLEECLIFTKDMEGKHDNDPDDPGGETGWGVTEAVARGYGYTGKMSELPWKTAVDIYRKQYWVPLNLDLVQDLMFQKRMIDFAINCGVPAAAKCLQEALNRLNNRGTRWADVVVDGHAGCATLGAVKECFRSPVARAQLLYALDVKRSDFYLEDIAKEASTSNADWDKNEKFVFGWQKRSAILTAESAALVCKLMAA